MEQVAVPLMKPLMETTDETKLNHVEAPTGRTGVRSAGLHWKP